MTRAVIFDIDGTLLHSANQDDRLYRAAVTSVLGAVRLRPSFRDYRPVTDTGILRQILADNELLETESVIVDVQEVFFAGMREHIETNGPFEEVDGARAYIARLRAAGVSVAVATGGWGVSARMKLESAGFDVRDVPLASSDDAVERTAIMQLALNALPGRYDAVTYYGDGPWDREATAALGWAFRPVGPMLKGIESFRAED